MHVPEIIHVVFSYGEVIQCAAYLKVLNRVTATKGAHWISVCGRSEMISRWGGKSSRLGLALIEFSVSALLSGTSACS